MLDANETLIRMESHISRLVDFSPFCSLISEFHQKSVYPASTRKCTFKFEVIR